MSNPLSIRESSLPSNNKDNNDKEMYVEGLSEYHIKNLSDTLKLLKISEENRMIRETQMNQYSSRSHSIFQIYTEQIKLSEDGYSEIHLKSKFNLVDLAG